eukprot:s1720_g3.t1
MDCFAKGSRWQEAFQLAFHMEKEGLKGNLIIYNLLLNACERSSQWTRALQLYQRMMRRRDLRPDVVSLNSSLGALVSATQWRRALQHWEEAADLTEPTEVTMNTLLMAYSSALQWQMAVQCWQGFRQSIASSEATFGVLMDAMAAPGVDWRFALELLNKSGRRSRNVVTYTSAAKVLSRAQQWEKALKLFEEMKDMKVPPNTLTVDVAMAAARSTQSWQKALQLLSSLTSRSVGLGCGALREIREVMEANAKRKEVEATQKGLSKELGRLLSDPFTGEEQPICSLGHFLEDLSLPQPLLHRRVLVPLTAEDCGELKKILCSHLVEKFGAQKTTENRQVYAMATCTLWDTSVAGWATDYVITLACVVCGAVALLQRSAGKEAMFLTLLITTGFSFGIGGVAHMLLFFVEESGEVCGSAFSEDNSGWMYPWLLSLIPAAFSPAALASMAAREGRFGFGWIIVVTVFLLAIIITIVEVAIFFARLEVSGLVAGPWIVAASVLALVLFLVAGLRSGFSRAVVYGVLSATMYMLGALAFLLLGGELLPDAFNANAVFHVLVFLMVVFAFLYRQQTTLPAPSKSETQEVPTSQKAEEGAEKAEGASPSV